MASSQKKLPMNHLSVNMYVSPGNCRQTMTRAQLKETLLATDGRILAAGNLWTIKSKHLGVGVYEVRLIVWLG